ncbi:hypothetical protein C439_06000 [Haloferax mediterranei ATCC 33500]|uniref:Uncharacterized protein n=2 Tax=Haloferax mediterranei (strain ATCC 33500 / DSM 1411 / JCM 8866 / NBRC 14739 / NCIMB 2177 / R-4) TaxID=523841 RepID=M0J260_HALMT|nr:hypothetical protein [Haloferax mediterranei]AHZ22014.1 hypothetical protein BM92_04755 [Haloferax mediterranei ATCC 33500]EMA02109.1 hypothetical protein C439_06000 [Haloferax mediterranei ATCC 33500]
MGRRQVSYLESIKLFLRNYISHYTETNLAFIGTLCLTGFGTISGLTLEPWLQNLLRIIGVVGLVISLTYAFFDGRPFGIDISCAPTHLVGEERNPDMMAKNRGLALIQDGESVIHGRVKISRFSNNFGLVFDTADGVGSELRMTPKSEQEYDPDESRLSCSDVSEREFQFVLEVFPKWRVESGGRYHWLEIQDEDTGKVLTEYQIIDVSH